MHNSVANPFAVALLASPEAASTLLRAWQQVPYSSITAVSIASGDPEHKHSHDSLPWLSAAIPLVERAALFASQPELVEIAGTAEAVAYDAVGALQSSLPVLLSVPPAPEPTAAQRIFNAGRRRKQPVLLSRPHRFLPVLARVHELLTAGTIGAIKQLTLHSAALAVAPAPALFGSLDCICWLLAVPASRLRLQLANTTPASQALILELCEIQICRQLPIGQPDLSIVGSNGSIAVGLDPQFPQLKLTLPGLPPRNLWSAQADPLVGERAYLAAGLRRRQWHNGCSDPAALAIFALWYEIWREL